MAPPMIIRVWKAWNSTENKEWSNTYEVSDGSIPNSANISSFGEGQINVTQADAAINQIVLFEKSIHLPQVKFLRATASTWVPDSTPYDPFALITRDLTGQGGRSGLLGPLDLKNVLVLKRVPLFGLVGNIWYRGVMDETDVTGEPGAWQINNEGFTEFVESRVDLYLSPLMQEEPTESDATLCMIGGTLHKEVLPKQGGMPGETVVKKTYIAPYSHRYVRSVSVDGVTTRSRDSSYYDRP